MQHEFELARQVQQRTYPERIPEIAGFDVRAGTYPAHWNNGDAYDAIGVTPRPDQEGFLMDPSGCVNHLVLVLADATGHGFAAALMATELRAMIRASIRLGVYHRDLVDCLNSQLIEGIHCEIDHHTSGQPQHDDRTYLLVHSRKNN